MSATAQLKCLQQLNLNVCNSST